MSQDFAAMAKSLGLDFDALTKESSEEMKRISLALQRIEGNQRILFRLLALAFPVAVEKLKQEHHGPKA